MQSLENGAELADPSYIQQHLRSIIIHSLDTFNYSNAEFGCERLVAMDGENLDLVHLYCLTLFYQGKYKSVYSNLVGLLSQNHLACSYLFAKACLKLKKYKEGIYQLVKLNYLYNESALDQPGPGKLFSTSPLNFTTSNQKFHYEQNRSVFPDSSAIYHLLGDLHRGINDVKNSALNYSEALKFNQFDFEALQELCKLGVEVRIKSIYKPLQGLISIQEDILGKNAGTLNSSTVVGNGFFNDMPNPFSSHIDEDTFSTPRVKVTQPVPDAPLRRSNLNTSNFEFTKPNFPVDDKKPRRESTYSRITSRLISQPPQQTKQADTPAKKSRATLKRSSSHEESAPSPSQGNTLTKKEIARSNAHLLKVYTVFGKSCKCMAKYDCYKAIRLLESLSEQEKESSAWVMSKLGRLHYEIVNYKQSEHFFVKLRRLDRTRLEDMEYYSTLLWHLHKKVELTYLCNELHDLDSNSPITWCAIGNLFSLTREPDEAIKCFQKATKLDETFTYAYTLKGHEYFGNDNYEMALENFRISLLIDPRHYNALYGIGMVCINLGDYHKADYHFRKAVLINPINIILICCVGMVLEKLGKKNLALRQYELANKLQPLNPLPIFKRAQLLFAMQQFPQALKYFEILKGLAPDEASVHFLLGQLYNIQDDKFRAIKEFTIALNLDPKGDYLIREAMESLKK